MSSPTYGPPIPSPHQLSAEASSSSRQNGGAEPLSTWWPNGIRAIIPAGSEYARSEMFWSPAGQAGRKVTLGDTFNWQGTFVADLGPARRLPQFHILWQLHAGTPAAEIPCRMVTGQNGLGIGGRDYAGGGAGTSWMHWMLDKAYGDVIEHRIDITMQMNDQPAGGNVLIAFDGQVVYDQDLQTWPDASVGVTDMIIRSGIYRGPEGQPAPRAQSCTWRDVSYTITP